MAIYGLRPVMLREVRLSDAQRQPILDVLRPHLLDLGAADAVLSEIEGLTSIYRVDLESGMNDPEQPREQTTAELDALAAAARVLGAEIHRLSAATRGRLTEIVAVERPEDPPEWATLVAPEALNRLAASCAFLEGRAALVRQWVESEPRPVGRRVKIAPHQFVHDLAALWERRTGKRLPVGNPDRTPWGRFVESVFDAVGAGGSPLYLARVVATHRRRE